MDKAELQQRVATILAEEERENPDWLRIAGLCEALDERLRNEPDTDFPDSVYHFVDDADIRQRDELYAEWQRDLVRRYVETGEMTEHAPSVEVPWWGCLLLVGVLVGVVVWLLV